MFISNHLKTQYKIKSYLKISKNAYSFVLNIDFIYYLFTSRILIKNIYKIQFDYILISTSLNIYTSPFVINNEVDFNLVDFKHFLLFKKWDFKWRLTLTFCYICY